MFYLFQIGAAGKTKNPAAPWDGARYGARPKIVD